SPRTAARLLPAHALRPVRGRGRPSAGVHQSPSGAARREGAARVAPVAVRDRAQLLPVGDRVPAAHGVTGGSHAGARGTVRGGAPARGPARAPRGYRPFARGPALSAAAGRDRRPLPSG